LQRAQFLHQNLPARRLEHATVDTAARPPDAIAAEIISRWGILARPNLITRTNAPG
jgi:hypothetical protein